MDVLSQDLRVALRRIQRAPALATAIVLTIGLGLGAAAAIFTTSDAALVEPLPYADPERLVHLWEARGGTAEQSPTSYPTLLDWRSRAKSFSGLEAYDPTNITVGIRDEARMLRGAQVTAGFFRLLGVRISAGRDFLDEDATTGAAVAIVSDRFARSVAGGIALDQTVVINGTCQHIVGVLPHAFHFALLQNADVFVPLIAGEQAREDRSQRSIYVIGRLRDRVPLTAARAEFSAAMSVLASEHPDALAGRTAIAVPLRDALLGNMKPILASLLVAVAILLVIMGANLALLMLTRYIERAPELAMRSALGATRARLLRQLLVESLVPSVLGAALALVVGQMTTRGLLVVSFSNLVRREVGFRDPEGLVTARAPLSGRRYEGPVAQRQFYEALLARSAALPGVRGAALIDEVPGGGEGITTFEPVDRPRLRSMQPRAALRIVGGEYFATLGIPIVRGRAFEPHDRTDTPPVAVVSASLAKLLGQEGATLGRRLRLAATGPAEWQGVGVVGDAQVAPLDADSPPVVYLSHLQAAENRMMLVLRTELGVASVTNQIRGIVKTLDAGIPVYAVTTLDQQLSDSKAVFIRRFPMMLCGVFAAAALALTLVALYAICMHEVFTRRREFGIRLALGGSPGSIRRLTLNDAMLLGATGIGVGGIVATVVSRSLRAVLFGITATDWRVYGVVAAGVLVSAVLATLGPALRAGSVHPSVVMRVE